MKALSKKVLFIVGPTGSGKSKLAFKLAKKLRGEIISADSMLVYRGMNIGTDKPSRWIRHQVKHHLLDIIGTDQEFSVYDYRKRALPILEAINRRSRWPIVVGGTGLYIKALVDGLSPQPEKNETVREKLRGEARSSGLPALYEKLSGLDPKAAERIHPHDEKRIVRALEVLELSGRRLSEWEKQTVSLEHLGYRYCLVGINWERGKLYRHINNRVEQMFQKGFLKEVQRLSKKTLSVTARKAIGYRELLEHLEGHFPLDEAKRLIQQRSRNLAKRQWTWFRRDARIRWIQNDGLKAMNKLVDEVVGMLKGFREN